MSELTLLIKLGIAFAYIGGFAFLAIGGYLSYKRGRLHPLLLVSIATLSICWIEAPYDWAMYAQFPSALPRMPSWWPLNMTWGGLPSAVPIGYIAYFVLPSLIGIPLGRWLSARFNWRLPIALLTGGLVVGCLWAFAFNAYFGALLGVFRYGYVIEGLAIRAGTIYQYPLYDSLAIGIQTMVFSYILGRTDSLGRTFVEIWADSRAKTQLESALLSVGAFILIAHVAYLSVFAPHFTTKMLGLVTVGPAEELFQGVPNQPHAYFSNK